MQKHQSDKIKSQILLLQEQRLDGSNQVNLTQPVKSDRTVKQDRQNRGEQLEVPRKNELSM